VFVRKVRAGKQIDDLDLFGNTSTLQGGGLSNAGRPRLPLRLMVSLLYLKHAFNESDEGVVERWSETPTWQYFSGMAYYEQRLPCDATALVKFRRALGEAGVEELLAQTIQAAVDLNLIKAQELRRVIVDTTVQEKAIAHPTDSRLLETARTKLVEAAREAGVLLKQTYASEGTHLAYRAGRYAHARQFRRMGVVIRRQRTIVGRLLREMQRKVEHPSWALESVYAKASKLLEQTQNRKHISGRSKLYSWHAPEVECINKGKSRRPYEFGCKVGIATTLRGNLIVGARTFAGNPYDGHTLWEQLDQASVLMQESGMKPTEATVDLGYRGVDDQNPDVLIRHRGKKSRLSPKDVRELARRQAIEPIIGHLKSDHRMDRCPLKGEMGDRIHAVLCAAGYNLRWLMRNLAKKPRRCSLALRQWRVYAARNAHASIMDWIQPTWLLRSPLPAAA
jgi:IS5 family transposase